MAKEKPILAAPLREPSPSWDELVHVEQLLTRFRFECEEFGLWPGAAGIRELREYTGAVGLIWELRRCHRNLVDYERKQYRPQEIYYEGKSTGLILAGPPTEVSTRRWLPFWSVEIIHIFRTLSALTSLVLAHWESLLNSDVVGGQLMRYEYTETEGPGSNNDNKPEDGNFIPGSHCLWVRKGYRGDKRFILPVDLAASIERCTTRLRTVLAAGPIEQLVWHRAEQSVIKTVELPGHAGRPAKCDHDTLAQELVRLREEGVLWKEIPGHVLRNLGKEYSISALKKHFGKWLQDRRAV